MHGTEVGAWNGGRELGLVESVITANEDYYGDFLGLSFGGVFVHGHEAQRLHLVLGRNLEEIRELVNGLDVWCVNFLGLVAALEFLYGFELRGSLFEIGG